LTTGSSVTVPTDVWPLAVPALGEAGATELLTILSSGDLDDRLTESALRDEFGTQYPYDYPDMTRILDAAPDRGRTPEAAALGAALAALSSRTGDATVANAPAAAYAVLDRARGAGDCEAQLDLLLLVAADAQPRDGIVTVEGERAEALCPGDPTAGWLQATYLSQRASADHRSPVDPFPAEMQERADEAFEELLVTYPEDAGVVAGWADNRVRFAQRTSALQPFTARHAFRQAGAGYRRARALSGSDEFVVGVARVRVGLGEPAAAAELLAGATGVASPGVRLQVLLQAQESAREFAAASATAFRLHQSGYAAFPQEGPAYPVPGMVEVDAQGPLGSDRYTPLTTVDLQPSPDLGGNGALVLDASYVPRFRDDPGITGTVVDCPDWAWRRDAVLAGSPAKALDGLPSGSFDWFDGILPSDYCPLNGSFTDLVRAEAGHLDGQRTLQGGPQSGRVLRANFLGDSRQNLWRWAGDLDRAGQVIGEWTARVGSDDPRPVKRLAEVRFLQREYDEAAALFGRAARLYRDEQWDNDVDVWEAQLQRGGALLQAGRVEEAHLLLRMLDERAAQGAAYQRSAENPEVAARFALVAYHARALLADSERDSDSLAAAVEDYEAARELVPVLLEAGTSGVRPARVDNNLAVTLSALDRGREALAAARQAVVADPNSPAFLFTAGVAAEQAADTDLAIDYYRRALASDPGTFPAANNLAVLLATERQRRADAVDALRRAVGVAPNYALGWFNIGAIQAERGPAYVLSAQGALARAYALDANLADRELRPTADDVTYRTGLDLAQPLPPRWSFARLQQASPATAASLLAVLLLGIGLIRSTGRGRGTDLASQFLEPLGQQLDRLPFAQRLRRPMWAILITAVVFVLPAFWSPGLGATSILAWALGVATLAAAGVWMRTALARRADVSVVQESWFPGMAFGLATGSLGAPWAPVPVVRAPKPASSPTAEQPDETSAEAPERRSADQVIAHVHAAAPVTFGALALVLFVESAWLGVPLTRAWAVAALIMTASTLVPIEPLDGARLSKGSVIGSAGVVAGALLVVLGVV
jgi:tetratricopeptide (TPR) repeat protein